MAFLIFFFRIINCSGGDPLHIGRTLEITLAHNSGSAIDKRFAISTRAAGITPMPEPATWGETKSKEASMTINLASRWAFACVIVACPPAYAGGDCAAAADQGAMNACAADQFKQEDARLNRLYKQLVGLSDQTEVAMLKQIQRSWIAFRDQHCEYERSRYAGGSMAPLVRFNCLRNLTRQRNDTLEALVKDFH